MSIRSCPDQDVHNVKENFYPFQTITMVEYAGTATTRAGTATVAVPAHFVADRICDCSSVVAVPAFDDM